MVLEDGPLEPPEGQDPDPPNTLLAVIVALSLLRDLRDRLQHDADDGDHEAPELLLRTVALLSVLRRVRRHLEGGG